VSAPQTLRTRAGKAYAQYEVDVGMGIASKRLDMLTAKVPKVRMKSPRTRAMSCEVTKTTMMPVTPVGMKRTVVAITEWPW
jgi:hypothetical protein